MDTLYGNTDALVLLASATDVEVMDAKFSHKYVVKIVAGERTRTFDVPYMDLLSVSQKLKFLSTPTWMNVLENRKAFAQALAEESNG